MTVLFNTSIMQVHKRMFVFILQWIHPPALWRLDIAILHALGGGSAK